MSKQPDFDRRYKLVADADSACDDKSQTLESLLRLNLKMQAEILAILAVREFNGN